MILIRKEVKGSEMFCLFVFCRKSKLRNYCKLRLFKTPYSTFWLLKKCCWNSSVFNYHHERTSFSFFPFFPSDPSCQIPDVLWVQNRTNYRRNDSWLIPHVQDPNRGRAKSTYGIFISLKFFLCQLLWLDKNTSCAFVKRKKKLRLEGSTTEGKKLSLSK